MAYRSPIADALLGAPGAVAAGVARDFAETKQNPTFVSAPVAKLGWTFSLAEVVVGAIGTTVSVVTRNDMFHEVTEGVLFAGVADTSANVAHYVRHRMNATRVTKSLPGAQGAPQAPSSLVGRVAQANLVSPLRPPMGRQAKTFVYPTANESVA